MRRRAGSGRGATKRQGNTMGTSAYYDILEVQFLQAVLQEDIIDWVVQNNTPVRKVKAANPNGKKPVLARLWCNLDLQVFSF